MYDQSFSFFKNSTQCVLSIFKTKQTELQIDAYLYKKAF